MWRNLLAGVLLLTATLHTTFAADSLGSSETTSAAEDNFLPVGEAYKPDVDVATDKLTVVWQIAQGYYLYRHGFKFELRDGKGKIDIQPDIPAGEAKTDDYFGKVEVYHQQALIDLKPAPAQRPLWLKITAQGCAEGGLCYPPYSQYFRIDDATTAAKINADEFNNAGNSPGTKSGGTSQTPPPAQNSQPTPANDLSLPLALLFAFLGGIILNLMPCVFPVLSLKLLSFAGKNPHLAHTKMHGVVYSIGVILSFVAVAALLLGLRAGGEAIGWGFHLQAPWFVAALTYLFLVMALALGGMLEIGTRLMGLGGGLAAQGGYGGSFFTGVLAVVVASPCSAPYMGSALGFAITQPPAIALAIFVALGAGMAAPFLLLSTVPALMRFMPKPGVWMDIFKRFMAFPMLLTCVWLVWVVGNQTSATGMALVLAGCLLLALAIWLHREHPQKPRWQLASRTTQWASVALALALLASPALQPRAQTAENGDHLSYTPERLQQLLAAGEPVFVNATADWCITCLTNEQVTLSKPDVRRQLQQKVTYLKADWTNEDPAITALLQQYGRSGVPLYLVYDGKSQTAQVLPQILTPSIMLEALQPLPTKTQDKQASIK